MAVGALSSVIGPAATIDPEILKAAIKRKADRVIDQNMPPAIKMVVSTTFKAGALACAAGIKVVGNHCLPGGCSIANSAIDSATQASGQACMNRVQPQIDECAAKTTDLTKQVAHKVVDKGVDVSSSCWS